ncbi:hypothetical protein APHAL10511_000593 [Amanita phalloides]|nr:hypothetical protein APHAL10511_000593 [Amanita phalloides]
MSLPVSISFPPPFVPAPSLRCHFPQRPRGLWRAHVTAARVSAAPVPDRKHSSISDTDDDEPAPPPQKKLRTRSGSTSDSDHTPLFCHYTRRCFRPPRSLPSHPMVSSSIARPSSPIDPSKSCDFDDWHDLKHLFARAAEHYEGKSIQGNDAAEGLPLLRAVIHECHHFLHFYPDPSSLFIVSPVLQSSPTPPPSDRKRRQGSSDPSSSTLKEEPRKSILLDLPTAFHALLGTSLFLFGNLIAQEPSLALEGEPTLPVPYWLAALDVFEMGESLPVRTRGVGNNNYPEDWRMAIIWGRTLVCLADDLVSRQHQAKREGHDLSSIHLNVDEPQWQRGSPFHTITAQRQPVTRRMSLNAATPNDLLVLAMDQFSRGIFHMPHDKSSQVWPMMLAATASASASVYSPPVSVAGERDVLSRERELYTIASEVLLIAEKLDAPSERHYWATWADSVLNQMKVQEADGRAWRSRVLRTRGRCRLIVGSAYVEDIEAALERGEMDVLDSEEAQEAREDLTMAADLFERAKAGSDDGAGSGSTEHELRMLLAEALLTLANLTGDMIKREELYRRAKNEAGPSMDLDLDDEDEGDRMDESH